MRSAGSLASTRVHHPDSFKADKPDRKISPLQCDRVPEMVPSHVFLFFLDIKSNEITRKDLFEEDQPSSK